MPDNLNIDNRPYNFFVAKTLLLNSFLFVILCVFFPCWCLAYLVEVFLNVLSDVISDEYSVLPFMLCKDLNFPSLIWPGPSFHLPSSIYLTLISLIDSDFSKRKGILLITLYIVPNWDHMAFQQLFSSGSGFT